MNCRYNNGKDARNKNRFAPPPPPLPQPPVVEAAGDEGGEEGRHANEDSDDEDADLHPGHPVVRPANQKPRRGHVRPDQERVKYAGRYASLFRLR